MFYHKENTSFLCSFNETLMLLIFNFHFCFQKNETQYKVEFLSFLVCDNYVRILYEGLFGKINSLSSF